MSKKAKVSKGKKEVKTGSSFKEIMKQNQVVSDLLKLATFRSDDTSLALSLMHESGVGLRFDLNFVKTTVADIESRELLRRAEEESLLAQLKSSKLDVNFHKKKFEKSVKKMMMINSKFEEKPRQALLSATEIQTHKIMNLVVPEENIKISICKKSQSTKPDLADAAWYENYSKSVKILDCMLIGETIDLLVPAKFCIDLNREHLAKALEKITETVKTLENPENIDLPSKTVLRDSFDYSSSLFSLLSMLSGFNLKIQKAMKTYLENISKDEWKNKPKVPRFRDLKAKKDRNLSYRSKPAVFPHSKLNTKQLKPYFDLSNPLLKEKNLEEKLKLVHSCLIIQRFIRFIKFKKSKNLIIIQKWVRGHLARKKAFLEKTKKFRAFFTYERLRHWYPLLVNKFRERKSRYVKINYFLHIKKILTIQKHIRGHLARKKITYWKKVFSSLRKMKDFQVLYQKKLKLWKVSADDEKLALLNTRTSEDDLKSFIMQNEMRGKKYSKAALEELCKSHLKNDADFRKSYFSRARAARMKVFEDIF